MGRIAALLAIGMLALFVSPAPVSASQPPLVIVFDISGSMNDKDSTGTVKLSTAKAAMTDLVRAQSPGVPLGLWTYPGGSTVDGCEAGGWVPQLAPDNQPDVTDVDAQIRALDADGGTPTGPALRAAAESLKLKGFDAATIVLVTDGESNCGPPPCEVAQDIINSGFDLTVAAVAFDIESGTAGELQCIADVTGGTFTQADNAIELINSLEQYQTKALELSVEGPVTVQAGAVMTFRATITNPSQQDVSGASLLIAFDDKSLVPFVPSPHIRLPVLQAGKSMSRTWTVSTRSQKTGQTGWRILAGTDMGSVSEAGAVRVTNDSLTRADGGKIFSDRDGPVVLLGDSYTSGEGEGPYAGSGPVKCHRADHAYGAVIGGSKSTIIACSGATSYDLRGKASNPGQPHQLKALSDVEAPDMVFLTIGGNDIGFGSIVESCFLGRCAGDRVAHLNNINRRSSPWAVYESVSESINTAEMMERRGGALAPVIVSPYPDPFWDPSRGRCNGRTVKDTVQTDLIEFSRWNEVTDVGFSAEEIRAGKDILAALNAKLEQGVAIAAGNGHPVYYADKTVDFAVGHTICESDSYFVRLTPGEAFKRRNDHDLKQELFHPNKQGHMAWANALISWSQRVTIDADRTVPTRPQPGFMDRAWDFLQRPVAPSKTLISEPLGRPDNAGEFPPTETTYGVSANGTVDIKITGLRPGSTVTITVESEPITLATTLVNDAGEASATVTLPTLETGEHHLVPMGFDTEYRVVGARIPLQVGSGLPIYLVAIMVLSGAAAVGLAATRLMRWRLRKKGHALESGAS